jgi:hypothetical protein
MSIPESLKRVTYKEIRKLANEIIAGVRAIPDNKLSLKYLLIVDDDREHPFPPKYMLYTAPTVRVPMEAAVEGESFSATDAIKFFTKLNDSRLKIIEK